MQEYNSEAIEVLSGLEPVRKRPGMYTETEDPNHLAQEVIDNSVDEVIAGFATKIIVTIHADNSITVIDNGRGMPVDIHSKEKVTGVEVILTKLHSGGKFNHNNYKFAGGLHGVGVSVVNALSSKFVAEIRRNGLQYKISFANSQKTSELEIIGKVAKKNSGTKITFYPEAKFFVNANFNIKKLKNNLRSKAILCPGLKVYFHNEYDQSEDFWCYDHGINDYLNTFVNDLATTPAEPILMSRKAADYELDIALVWTTENSNIITESFVNLIPTKLGGTHVNGLRQGVYESVIKFCQFHNLFPKNIKLNAEDTWQQLSFVLSVKMLNPQFSGQTKERLSSRQAIPLVINCVRDTLSLWLSDNVEDARKIVEMAVENSKIREKRAKTVIRKKNIQGPTLPGKLADCTINDLEQTEVFLVEGDSAGGSAKQARDKDYQAILPLRGKILNTWDILSDEILKSSEIFDITTALGVEPKNYDLSRLRYGKICILADADSDGAHIATLICALFVRHFPHLVKSGHVFVAMPPLYRIDAGSNVYYALDDNEKNNIVKKITKKIKINVQRFKGLGEMNPSQLRETTMNPLTRRLIQLTLNNDNETDVMDMLLNKKRAADRKIWLSSKGNLADV